MAATRLICWLCILHAKYKYKLFPHVRVVPDKESAIYNDILGEKNCRRYLDVNLDDPRFAKVRSRLEECYAPRTYLVSYPNDS